MHDFLSTEYTVKEAGYAYVYISNETPTQVDVYFDDVTMTYTPTNVLQVNEYYPYGLQTASSWTREGNSNNFLYNGGTEQNTTTGLYDLAYRNFDPALGRFHQVDPMASNYSSQTPYSYANGNPALFNDPSGLESYESPGGYNVCLFARSFKDANYAGDPGRGGGAMYYPRVVGWNSDAAISIKNFVARFSASNATAGSWSNGSYTLYGESELEQAIAAAAPTIGSAIGNFRIVDYFSNGDESRYIDSEIIYKTASGLSRRMEFTDPSLAAQGAVTVNGTRLYSPPDYNVVGMFVSMRYTPSSSEREKYSKFGWVLTVWTTPVSKNAPSPHNEPYSDNRPTRQGEDPYIESQALRFSHNALMDWPSIEPSLSFWAEVSAVGFADGQWHPLVNMHYGWTFVGDKLEAFPPEIGTVSDWHLDSINNNEKW
jgi:RHS repeat-associated protein